ncbi:RNase H domain-containing protein [Trichonephila clavipes]|nr:RNase H domain-containing protein [Trichonephila clavipes]
MREGAGVFCDLFSCYFHVDSHTNHYDGEIEAIHFGIHQLSAHPPTPEKAVLLSDSCSAIQALASNQIKSSRVRDCRELLSIIPSKVVFQLMRSRCGPWGNDMADLLAKGGTGILQRSTRGLPFHSAKLEIKVFLKNAFEIPLPVLPK